MVDKGNLIVVIEYNLDVICCVDWVLDLGLEGGDKGGEIIVCGIFEEVVDNFEFYIGKYLWEVLEKYLFEVEKIDI